MNEGRGGEGGRGGLRGGRGEGEGGVGGGLRCHLRPRAPPCHDVSGCAIGSVAELQTVTKQLNIEAARRCFPAAPRNGCEPLVDALPRGIRRVWCRTGESLPPAPLEQPGVSSPSRFGYDISNARSAAGVEVASDNDQVRVMPPSRNHPADQLEPAAQAALLGTGCAWPSRRAASGLGTS